MGTDSSMIKVNGPGLAADGFNFYYLVKPDQGSVGKNKYYRYFCTLPLGLF